MSDASLRDLVRSLCKIEIYTFWGKKKGGRQKKNVSFFKISKISKFSKKIWKNFKIFKKFQIFNFLCSSEFLSKSFDSKCDGKLRVHILWKNNFWDHPTSSTTIFLTIWGRYVLSKNWQILPQTLYKLKGIEEGWNFKKLFKNLSAGLSNALPPISFGQKVAEISWFGIPCGIDLSLRIREKKFLL